jgi:Fe-Mn family superoxide dismutase
MVTIDPQRRDVLRAGAALAALAALPATTAAPAQTPPPPAAGFAVRPLPFDPKATGWLSEALILSHHGNNYAGAVRRLGTIRTEIGALDPARAPGFQLNGLKREELIAWNSMILHELYFAGLVAAEALSPALGRAIERDFGSVDRWAADFAATGKALGGGSGWVLLTWDQRDGRLVNQWAADHSMTLAGGIPLLALDMYEHAYAMDFGARAGAYVDGFMKGMSWAHANRTFARLA